MASLRQTDDATPRGKPLAQPQPGAARGLTGAPVPPASTTDAPADHEQRVADIVASDLVPALLRAHDRAAGARANVTASAAIEAHVGALASALVAPSPSGLHAWVDDWRREGLSLERIYLEIMTPAASALGDGWLSDRLDFASVTLGLWRLQRLMLELSPSFVGDSVGRQTAAARTCLMTPVPHAQHTLGLLMVAEFFRRAGWRVEDGAGSSRDELTAAVAANTFDLVGLSLGSSTHRAELADLIKALRRASCNASLKVMVGGPVVTAELDIAALGADAAATNAPEAVLVADLLVTAAAPRAS